MPEAPEVGFLAEYLKKLINDNITQIEVLKGNEKIKFPKKSRVIDIGSKGKKLWIQTKDYYIHINLMLTGWVILNDESKNTKYKIITDKNKIYITTRRNFTNIKIYKHEEHEKKIKELGEEVFSNKFTLEYFKNVITKSKIIISSLLINQTKFAGIGNYIKNEALYISKINPKRIAKSLNLLEIKRLHNAVRYVAFSCFVEQLNENNIKIPKNIKKILPKKIQTPYNFRVYGRKIDNQGNEITNEQIAGRTTYFVESRQK